MIDVVYSATEFSNGIRVLRHFRVQAHDWPEDIVSSNTESFEVLETGH
jgi:hypothetical protein